MQLPAIVLISVGLLIYIMITRVSFKVYNHTSTDVEISWICGARKEDKILIPSAKVIYDKYFIRCEGKFGVSVIEGSQVYYKFISEYSPVLEGRKYEVHINKINKVIIKEIDARKADF